MPRCRTRRLLAAAACTATLGTTVALPAAAVADQLDQLHGKALAEAKVRADIRAESGHKGTDWSGIGTFVTAVVGIGGFLLTIRTQNRDARTQRDKDREAATQALEHEARQRDADREAAVREAEQRFDEQFNRVVTDLGAAHIGTRVGAAVGTVRFLDERYAVVHDDVTRLLVAQLKVQTDKPTLDVLLRGLERAFRLRPLGPADRDLASAYLTDVDLSGLTFPEQLTISDSQGTFANFAECTLTDLVARRANLEKATFRQSLLQGASFRGANCEGTDFSGARLVSARFREATLRNTNFRGALLQSAVFQGTTLTGTRFDGANINDAHFERCTIAPETIRSLSRAQHWSRAHFDDGVQALVAAAAAT